MKKNLVFNTLVCLVILVAWSWIQSGYGQEIPADVSKRIAQWLGEKPTSKGKVSFGWLELDVYSTRSGQVFVDPKSGKIVMMSLRPKRLSEGTQKDVGMDEALNCALRWMEQRGISMEGWVLEEKYRYDRGSGGIEYMFTWCKYSPDGVQLPSFMKVLVSGDGEISYWFGIDKPISISLTPKVSTKDALLKAKSIVGEKYELVKSQRLRVWFHEKKQQLWWEIVLSSNETEKDWAVITIDAHTGELVNVLRPSRGSDWVEKERERYLQNARKVAKELGRCVKIEIFHIDVLHRPVAVLKQGDKKFQKLLLAVRKLLQKGEGIIGAPPYLLLAEFPLIRFYIAHNIAYEAKFSPRAAYFELLQKAQLHRKGGKEFWQRLEATSVVVHKCPKEFMQQMLEIMKQISILKSLK